MIKNKLRIVFFGSGKIAVPTLEFLLQEKTDIVCVVTSPDAKKGRHLLTAYTPIKEFALKHNLNIFQPQNIYVRSTIDYLKGLHSDIFIVFSFGKILPMEILGIPLKYPLNIHASLLPKYRGAAPINWALINGDKKTGITIIRMNERMDSGDIVLKNEIDIDYNDNSFTLEEKLAELAPHVLKQALFKIKDNTISFSKQNDKETSFAPKLKKEDGRIFWNRPAEEIRNKIRGLLIWPGTFTFYKNKMLKIWDADVVNTPDEEKIVAGRVVGFDKNGIAVATKPGFLLIKELQLADGKKISAWDFIQGHKIEKNSKFE